MCFTGFEPEVLSHHSRSPRDTPVQEIPAFTLRPPSIASEFGDPRSNQPEVYTISPGGRTFPLKPTVSNESGLSRRPFSERTQSTTTISRQPRHPITNAIDVWALGVTLYCLLFGKTPFDAHNEYQLMQVIPTAEYDIPRHITSEYLPTSNAPLEVQNCLDLLRRLLTKDPQKRISLEQAKVRRRTQASHMLTDITASSFHARGLSRTYFLAISHRPARPDLCHRLKCRGGSCCRQICKRPREVPQRNQGFLAETTDP